MIISKLIKHIDIRHHFVRDVINEGTVKVRYRATVNMMADLFTKALLEPKQWKCFLDFEMKQENLN